MDEQQERFRRDGDYASRWVTRALDAGEVVEVEGIPVRKVSDEVRPGDLYVGARNTANLLTAKRVGEMGCVWPEEMAYPFSIGECVRVEAVL